MQYGCPEIWLHRLKKTKEKEKHYKLLEISLYVSCITQNVSVEGLKVIGLTEGYEQVSVVNETLCLSGIICINKG